MTAKELLNTLCPSAPCSKCSNKGDGCLNTPTAKMMIKSYELGYNARKLEEMEEEMDPQTA